MPSGQCSENMGLFFFSSSAGLVARQSSQPIILMTYSKLIHILALTGALAGASSLRLSAADASAAMPAAILQMARRAAEPAYASTSTMLADSRDLNGEITRMRFLLDVLKQTPELPAATVAWRQLQPEAEKCGTLLQRMMQIEQSKPGNFQTFIDGAGLVQGLNHDSEKASGLENLDNAVSTLQAAKGLWDRIAAESDLSDLRRQYRAAQNDLRIAAAHLYSAYDQSMSGAVGYHGFVGMVLENTIVKETVPGSSAQAAGVMAGDIIQDINGRSVAGMDTVQVRSLLIGNPGTKARVTFAKAGVKELERKRDPKYSLLGHQYHSSMNGAFFGDHLMLTNHSGKTLTNCLLRIRRLDGERRHFTRVHYCSSWKAGDQLHFGYRPQDDYQPGEDFDDIDTIEVALISEQLRDDLTIDYGPAVRAADYAANFDSATLSLSRREYVKGMIWDDHRGVSLSLGNVKRISPSKITITLHQSRGSYRPELTKSIRWNGSEWASGQSKTFTDSGFDHIIPDGWKVELEFPHTTYHPTFTWGTYK